MSKEETWEEGVKLGAIVRTKARARKQQKVWHAWREQFCYENSAWHTIQKLLRRVRAKPRAGTHALVDGPQPAHTAKEQAGEVVVLLNVRAATHSITPCPDFSGFGGMARARGD